MSPPFGTSCASTFSAEMILPEDEAWFYGKGEDPIGPHTPSEMRELFASGELEARDLVWTEGMENWVEARTLDFLRPGPPSSQPPAYEETDILRPIETIDEIERAETPSEEESQ